MKIRFTIEKRVLPLRYAWKLSRNTATEKVNFIIRAEKDGILGLGEVAPNIRYQETPERVLYEFDSILPSLNQNFSSEAWTKTLDNFSICQSLKMGLDMAFQRLAANSMGISLSSRLQIQKPEGRSIAYTIPVMEPAEIPQFIEREGLHRFSWIKVKVNSELARPMLECITQHIKKPIAIDGNEAWTSWEEALAFAHELDPKQIMFLEQPLSASQTEDYPMLTQKSPIPIWGDESILYHPEPDYWKSAFKGINVKLMKAGSFFNAIQLLKTAKQHGLQTMVGCMVETSIGISAALELESLADYMDLDGFLLLRNEPYGLVKEENGMVGFTSASPA